MKKMLFIYNPNAGTGVLKPKLSDALDIFTKSGYEVTVHPTQKPHDAVEKIQECGGEYDRIVCAGGDGTLDEAVTGMRLGGLQTSLGYIPAGTTNDFAASLGIPKDILAAADTAVNGIPFPCDVGEFNGDHFIYIAAFGIFTDVSYETRQSMKNILGHLAYLLEGAKRIFNIPSYKVKVTHDGESFEDEFIFGMVTNSRSVGGFKGIIGSEIIFDDGEFEVTLIRTPKNPIELNELLGAILMKQINPQRMYSFKSGEVKFECEEEIPWTLDGEFGGTHREVVVRDRRQALSIMVNEIPGDFPKESKK
ncbi:MAG TPA: YegS/Rv2252/BmrU family lipid kinase [Candidatus Mediterraneibacter pullicola]|uniref:YegS/Rv2252/BmrU family lipid kinase n=1 Tax=Candidatus Mediterraneibacter pullicola TaxID=2838682 RepID=A0A9D2HB03_9FIRM|nr:YegS/Rv2252/BmrU family lipid kinase [Candidatus Mediterraneibacter pullicola]